MSLEKAIQKLTNAVAQTAINTEPPSGPTGPSSRPNRRIDLPPKKFTCKTESVGNDPNTGLPMVDPQTGYPMVRCVCRHGQNCILATWEGPCMLEGFTDTVPFETPCK